MPILKNKRIDSLIGLLDWKLPLSIVTADETILSSRVGVIVCDVRRQWRAYGGMETRPTTPEPDSQVWNEISPSREIPSLAAPISTNSLLDSGSLYQSSKPPKEHPSWRRVAIGCEPGHLSQICCSPLLPNVLRTGCRDAWSHIRSRGFT